MTKVWSFLKNPFLASTSALAIVINAGLWWYLFRTVAFGGETTPLHYNIYFGIDLVGPEWYLYALPVAGLLVILVNAALSVILWNREQVVVYFLTIGSLLVQAYFFLTTYLSQSQI